MQQEYKGWTVEQVVCDSECRSALDSLGLGARTTCFDFLKDAYKAYPPYEMSPDDFLRIWRSKILPDIKDWPVSYVCGGSLERVEQLIDIFEDAIVETKQDTLNQLFQDDTYK